MLLLLVINSSSSKTWEIISESNEYIEHSQNVTSTLGGSFQTIGKNNTLIGLLNSMNSGDITEVIKSPGSVFIARLISKDIFDELNYEEVKDSIKTKLINLSKSQIFNQWLTNEKEKIDIKDLRFQIF